MHKRQPVPANPLQDESLTTEKTRPKFLMKRNVNLHAARPAHDRRLLAKYLTTHLRNVHRHYLSRIRRSKGHLLAAISPRRKSSQKQRLSRHHALPGLKQLAEHPLLLRRIAKDRLHLN